MIDVSIIVVTYNAKEWVPRCLDAIREARGSYRTETIVLDNASTEFGPSDLRNWAGPEAQVIALEENIGFGRGCNRAVSESVGDFVLLLNPDALIEAGAIEALVDLHRSRDEIGIVGGRVLTPEGALDRGSCFGFQTLWSLLCFATGASTAFPRSARFNPEGLGPWERDSIRPVGVVTGCLLLIDRPLWDQLDGFDERLFMYGEDADLCARARQLGKQAWITPEATVIHALGASSGTALNKQVMLFRGKASLVRNNHVGLRRGVELLLLQMGVGLRALGEQLTHTDRAAWRGLWTQRRQWRQGWS